MGGQLTPQFWNLGLMSDRNFRLDSLRGIAASVVVLHHAINLCDLTLGDRAFTPLESADLPGRAVLSVVSGSMAVNIFFILSGAVLANSLMREQNFSLTTCASFVVRRALRIYPALIVAVVAMGLAGHWIVGPGWHPYAATEILQNALLLTNDIIGPTWTLQVEMLMVPLILLAGFLNRMIGTAALVLFLLFGLYCLLQGTPLGLSILNIAIFSFGLGMLVPTNLMKETFKNAPQWLWWVSLSLLPIVRLFLPVDKLEPLIFTLLLSFCAVGSLYYNAAAPRTALDNASLRFMGKISYSLYLNHAIVIYSLFPLMLLIFGQRFITENAILVGTVFGFLSLAITTPIAAVSERFLERPFTGRRADRHPAPKTVPAPAK